MRVPPAFQAHPRHNSRVQISAILSICASASVREICGSSALVRYCDDFVMRFAHKEEAERVHGVLGKRLGRFGMQLHPERPD